MLKHVLLQFLPRTEYDAQHMAVRRELFIIPFTVISGKSVRSTTIANATNGMIILFLAYVKPFKESSNYYIVQQIRSMPRQRKIVLGKNTQNIRHCNTGSFLYAWLLLLYIVACLNLTP